MIIIDPTMDKEFCEYAYNTSSICEKVYGLPKNTNVFITFNSKACQGFEAVCIPGKDEFLVALSPNIEWEEKNFVKTIAHELAHVRQFTYDGLEFGEDEEVICFRSGEYRFTNEMEYWLAPWEIEARGYEDAIWHVYCQED